MPATRYNVLEILSDQHQAALLGCAGHAQVITPNLDRLAGEGVRFTQAYTQNPICTPSRVCILSGQYCHNHGYYGLSGPAPRALPNRFGHFRSHGYRTAGIGKLHTPNAPDNWLRADLDLYADCYEHGRLGPSPYFAYLRERGLLEDEDSIGLPEFPGNQQNEARPSRLPFEHSVEGWCVAQARDFMDQCRRDAQPFCMQVSLPRPHQCYTPDPRFWNLYPESLACPPSLHRDPSGRPPHFRAVVEWYRLEVQGLIEPRDFESLSRRIWHGYLACISQVDHAVGLLLEYVRDAGLGPNTIVVYGSDHGAYSTTYGIPEKAPGICSDAVCRVPMLWRVPGLTPAGRVCAQLVENVDITPTLTALCGLPPMETVDGCALTPLLQGEDAPLHAVAVTENPWSKSIRFDDWRLVHYQPEMFPGQDCGELYNVVTDPDETRNRYRDTDHQAVVERGRRLLLEWLIRTMRINTMWPAVDWSTVPYDYRTAGDGKESNAAGPAWRVAHGQLNYL